MARTPQIYVRSGAPDFGIANTIEDLGHRIAPRPQIYVKSEASVLGMANTIGEAGRRVAQGAQITGEMGSASHGRLGSLPPDEDLPQSSLFRWPNHDFSWLKSSDASTAPGSEGSEPGFTRKLPVPFSKP